MREKDALYFGMELTGTALSLALLTEEWGVARCVVVGLCFACAFAAAFLLRWTGRVPRLAGGLCAAAAFASLLLQPAGMLPLLAVLIAELADRSAGRYVYGLTAAALVLLVLLFPPDGVRVAVAAALLAPLLFARWYVERLAAARAALERSREEIDGLNGRLRDDRRLMKTLQYTARLEERNRLAARIHDKIGHGVSGSILLLEAALLQMDSAPEKARKSVEKAAANLREGVDAIRLSLREERPPAQAGPEEITAALTRFSETHGVKTAFRREGRTEEIPPAVWNCAYQNLTEALTNLLKHSSASAFTLKVTAANKIVRVEFRDNGAPAGNGAGSPQTGGEVRKGMGLEAMEERVVLAGGRFFCEKGPGGFSIVQLFPLNT